MDLVIVTQSWILVLPVFKAHDLGSKISFRCGRNIFATNMDVNLCSKRITYITTNLSLKKTGAFAVKTRLFDFGNQYFPCSTSGFATSRNIKDLS